jgi:radical SAM superfamily enzyme YgiQ (UPF0313 family)
MRILLIQPSWLNSLEVSSLYKKHGTFKVLRDRGEYATRIKLPPLGLMYLAAPLVNCDHQVRILDASTLELTNGETVREAIDFQPDLIGITLYSRFLKNVYILCGELKKKLSVPIVLGGPHVTVMPEKVLEEFESVDYLIGGWGEFSIGDFAEYLGQKVTADSVPGLCYRRSGAIVKNPPATIPENENDIPVPNRNLLNDMYEKKLYFNIMSRRRNMDVLITSRNCLFACNFCFQSGKYYEHSAERVLKEIREMATRGVDAIEIMDDSFTLNRKRAERIVDGILEEGLDLEFRIRSRVNSLDERLLRKLKEIGTRSINFGMESGCDDLLKMMNKKTSVSQNENICRLTKKAGILCQTSWIIGYPGETRRMREQTLAFINRILPNTVTCNYLVPYPGTKVYQEARQNDTLVGEWSIHSDDIYIAREEFPDIGEYRSMVVEAQNNILTGFAFIIQTLKFLAGNLNHRLVIYGFYQLSRKIFARWSVINRSGRKLDEYRNLD